MCRFRWRSNRRAHRQGCWRWPGTKATSGPGAFVLTMRRHAAAVGQRLLSTFSINIRGQRHLTRLKGAFRAGSLIHGLRDGYRLAEFAEERGTGTFGQDNGGAILVPGPVRPWRPPFGARCDRDHLGLQLCIEKAHIAALRSIIDGLSMPDLKTVYFARWCRLAQSAD